MGTVEFDEEPLVAAVRPAKNSTRSLASWLIRSGIAKDEQQAQQRLLVLLVSVLVLTGGIFFFGSPKNRHVPYNSPDQTMVPDKNGPSGIYLQ